jgi:hypothetical protein
MPKVAKTEPGTTINYGEHVFEFADGSRQVSEQEIDVLRRYEAEGGPAKVEITDAPKKKGG